MAVDKAGRLFVPEGSESVVYAFAPNGKFLAKIGAKGSGPGEFNGVCCASVDPAGRLWVRDIGNARYVVFSLSDESAPFAAKSAFVVRMPHQDVNLWATLSFDSRGNFFDVGHSASDNDPSLRVLSQFLVDTSGRIIRATRLNEQLDGASKPFTVTRRQGNMVASRFYYQPFGSSALRSDGAGGQYATAASGRYEILWFAANGTRRVTIRGSGSAIPLSSSQKKAAMSELREIAAAANSSVQALPFGVPKTGPVLRNINFDSNGRLWVERVRPPGAPRESDVYDANGILAFVAVWPAIEKMTFFGTAMGRSAWVTSQDADDIPHIVRVQF